MIEKLFKINEDSDLYKGWIIAGEAPHKPGMIQLDTYMEEKSSGLNCDVGIRLSRQDARSLAAHLNALADQLFFEERSKK